MHTPIDSERGRLLERYICARITSMTHVDIGLFDYDRHNALYYFAMNADEQIYLRYGGRDTESPDTYLDPDSFNLALRTGLEQHKKYRANVLPHTPRPAPFRPGDMALLKEDVIDSGRCVECHLIADYRLIEKEMNGTLDKLNDLFVYPDTKQLGIFLDIPKGLAIREATGAAAEAGLRSGDRIAALNGTDVWTYGDFQYALNKVSKDAPFISLTIEREGTPVDITVRLRREWWYTTLEHRFWTVEPRAYFSSRPLSAAARRTLDLPEDGLAAEVTRVDPAARVYNLHQLREGDTIVSINGVRRDAFTQNLDLYIILNVEAGTAFTVEYLRENKLHEMRVRTHREHFRKPKW